MLRETITFRTESERRERLDRAAALMDRDRTYVLNQAVDAYLDLMDWQEAHIHAGLEDAEAGRFASDEEIEKIFDDALAEADQRQAG